MSVLVTGASGFLGTVLIEELLKKGHRVYGLSRHPPQAKENLIPLVGDITQPNLGLSEVPKIDCIYHLAGIHSLRQVDKDNAIYSTNVLGTKNVLDAMVKHDIKKLIFTSTAYALGWEDVNPYARSKVQNEKDIAECVKRYGLSATVLRPSIIMGEPDIPYEGHFIKFVKTVVMLHRHPERARKVVEGVLRLPLLQAVFRIPGSPNASLNLIQISDVVQALLNFNKPGSYWIVNHQPPTLQQIATWVGEVVNIEMRFMSDKFTPSLIESIFQRKGKPFLPYLWGDDFTSKADIKAQPIDRAFIQHTVRSTLKS